MKILVSDDVNEQGVALLREHYDVDVKTNMPPEELLKCIGEYDGLVTRSQTQVTQEVIDCVVCRSTAAAHRAMTVDADKSSCLAFGDKIFFHFRCSQIEGNIHIAAVRLFGMPFVKSAALVDDIID